MRYTNIQFLRVAAAVGVVLYHLGAHAHVLVGLDPHLHHNIIAGFPVPLFFAVSGFVLTHALRTAPPGRFLAARVLRLYPGYWLALLGAAALMRLRVFTEYHRWLIYFVDANAVALWPCGDPGGAPRFLGGIEWSLVYEMFLSVALAAFGLVGRGRAVPALAAAWLAVLAVKMIALPGYGFDAFAHWSTIALSAYSVPFLLGVLVYQVHGANRRWAWAVGPATAACLYATCTRPVTPEQNWTLLGLAAAGTVWLAVVLPQADARNRLARLGDCTYGLFLFHVPLMFAVFYPAARLGWAGRWEVVWLAGVVSIGGGLLFGRLECALHARLRPLARIDISAVARRLVSRIAGWLRPRTLVGR